MTSPIAVLRISTIEHRLQGSNIVYLQQANVSAATPVDVYWSLLTNIKTNRYTFAAVNQTTAIVWSYLFLIFILMILQQLAHDCHAS